MTGVSNYSALFALSIDGSSDPWQVVKWRGSEAISSLFRFEIEATGEEIGDPAPLIGKPAVLSIVGETETRFIHGIVAAIFEGGRNAVRQRLYEITVVPREFRLTQTRDCRIFQQKTVPDIVKDVLKFAKIKEADVKFQLNGSYSPRDYCVQYRESDWAFISRLLEEEGIFYYFDHSEGDHTLIIADKSQAHEPISGEAHLQHLEIAQAATIESIGRFRYGARLGTGHVTLQDFDFVRPALDLKSDSEATLYADLEAYDYPGEYDAPAGGRRLAKVRVEEQARQHQTVEGQSNCGRLMAGRKFTLEDQDGVLRDDLQQEYVITQVHHHGEQNLVVADGNGGNVYGNDFEALPLSIPYRPLRVTPRPMVQGVQTAIVVGPNGQEIYTDAHGRVKVHFHWDRVGSRNEQSSCWIRVSQAWAGEGWGFMAIPRIGHEVIVSFLEGNPDRPMVTGRVYHGTNTPPYELPANATRTTLMSNSSPGGGGFNELRFEDAAGSEEIFIHGQKDWNIVIKNDKTQKIGHDETLNVTHDRTKDVGNDQHETVHHDKTIQVGNNHTESITNDCAITIGGNHDEQVHKNRTEAVTQNQTLDVGGDSKTTVKGNLDLTIMRTKNEKVLIASEEMVGAAKSVSVGGAYSVTVGATMSTTVVGSLGSASGGATQITAKGNLSLATSHGDGTLDAKKKLDLHSGEDMGIKSDKKMSVSSKEDMSVASEKKMMIEVTDEVTIKCGDATVKLSKNGDIEVTGKKITIKGSGDVAVKGSKVGLN